jgi:hypothetical protein
MKAMSKEKQDMTDLIETALHAENKVKRAQAVRSMSIRSCVPKDRLLSYLNGGKPNYGDFHEIARAVGINYNSFVKKYGP